MVCSSAIIILLISPIKLIIYLLLIFVLQQFDGLYLGPKILGDSTGLRPIWIIFAITFGGAVAGVIGMFLGVPIVAVIAFLIGRWVDSRLNDKEQVEASEIMESNTNKSV
ncbi:MAG: AI-2E family transporter [Lachnospiraceae bacterium]